ncbi:MAG: urea ABC transporter permease subunit UrtC [Alphaproteobacteria bacterium]|nr:urea ABC transporter permease subunit UrtC [Alphaproteobacteria bacterium]
MNQRFFDRHRIAEIAVYLAFIAVVLAMPAFIDEFTLNRFSKYLVYGMLGIAIALSWGYAGILNLGQGLFFGLGAYMVATSLKLQSYTSLQQGSDTPVPDFMLWNAQPGAPTDLCCITDGSFLWLPFQAQWFGIAMAIVLPTLVAFLVGSAIFRLRISGVYVAIITLALVLLVRPLIIEFQPVTNGFNGLTDLGWLTFGGFEFDPYLVETYYVIAIPTVLVLLGARWLVATRAGLILQATRDDANRARYLGFSVAAYQVFFFSVSAAIAGFAGMLYVVASEFASPTFMDIAFSISMLVWAAVGGRRSLLGACIGAILINSISAAASETEMLQEAWKAILGLIFILGVLFLPRGLAGLGHDFIEWLPLGRRGATRPQNGNAGSEPAE